MYLTRLSKILRFLINTLIHPKQLTFHLQFYFKVIYCTHEKAEVSPVPEDFLRQELTATFVCKRPRGEWGVSLTPQPAGKKPECGPVVHAVTSATYFRVI